MDANYLFIGDICKLESITSSNDTLYSNQKEISIEDYLNEQFTYNAKKVTTTVLYQLGNVNKIYLDIRSLKKYTGEYLDVTVGEYFINEESLIPLNNILSHEERNQDLTRKKVLTRFNQYQLGTKKTK